MESLLLIAILIAVIVLVWRQGKHMQALQWRFDYVDQELQTIRKLLASQQTGAKPAPAEKAASQQVPAPVLQTPVSPPVAVPPASGLTGPTVKASVFTPPAVAEPPQPGLVERFLKNNPDLEKFIGENLINKIGIAILVLGIGYFVKFAIDQNWINEIGRVCIGLLAGGGLIGLAHGLRRTLPAFSSVLVGGGLAVLYFTIAIAFHQYRLFPQPAAFVLMVLITGFSILLSVSYNRVELAVLSLLGGFATPFLVATGSGNYQVLFTYILILNTGMLILAYLRSWKILNWIAYGFTVILYGGWLSTRVLGQSPAPLAGALAFGTTFYLIFFLMNIINNIRQKARFEAAEISILLSNTFLYYAAGMLVLAHIRQGLFQGMFTVVLAGFNLVFAWLLFRSQRADRNLIYLLLGLVITFISLAIPVQLEGNYITMFWSLEAVLLLWLYQKSGLRMVFLSAVLMLGLMLISLLMDWNTLYQTSAAEKLLPVLINKAFITSFIALLALALTSRLLARLSGVVFFPFLRRGIAIAHYRILVGGLLATTLYFALALELHYQLQNHVSLSLNRIIITGTYNLAYLVALLLFARRQGLPLLTQVMSILAFPGVLAYLVLFSPSVLELLKTHFREEGHSFIGFPFHYLSLLLIGLLLWLLYRNVHQLLQRPATVRALIWVLCAAGIFIASSELLFHVLYFNLPGSAFFSRPDATLQASERLAILTRQTIKVGFPILWGACAFVLMFAGLRQKNKNLRIIALSLFTLTLLKLFLYDIRGISEGGRIAAFIFLGVLLLVISFMYQNLKRLILTDENHFKSGQ